MRAVYVVVPAGIDDPTRPSGGNSYDRRVCQGLADLGWTVEERPVPGSWPRPDAAARELLRRTLSGVPDRQVVLVDGLVASAVPEVLVPQASRLRLVVLMHMPLGEAGMGDRVAARVRERAVLAAAEAVVTTSGWTRARLLDRYPLRPDEVHVAEPGVDPADVAAGTASGERLLCVGAVTPGKGQDVLAAALAAVADLTWRCACVGSLDIDPGFVDRLRDQVREAGIGDRLCLTGPLVGAALEARYSAADLLVLASRAETYGMVVTEALARGLPVVAAGVGGLPEALGQGSDGSRPGLLVPPGDPAALASALRSWLVDADLRRRLRTAAVQRRASLRAWSDTSLDVARVLSQVAA